MATPEYARSDGNATPDPWTVEPRFDAVLEGYAPPTMYEVVFLDHLIAEVTSEADANLIAAAPELLAVAEDVVNIFGPNTIAFRSLADKARAAIAKAKGGL